MHIHIPLVSCMSVILIVNFVSTSVSFALGSDATLMTADQSKTDGSVGSSTQLVSPQGTATHLTLSQPTTATGMLPL